MEGCLVKPILKKVVIYSLVGILQCGFGVAALEASPRHDEQRSHEQQRDNRDRHEQPRYENDRRSPHDRRQEENDRHEREMERRHHENERQWRERQRIERERHDDVLRDIEAAAIIYLLLSN